MARTGLPVNRGGGNRPRCQPIFQQDPACLLYHFVSVLPPPYPKWKKLILNRQEPVEEKHHGQTHHLFRCGPCDRYDPCDRYGPCDCRATALCSGSILRQDGKGKRTSYGAIGHRSTGEKAGEANLSADQTGRVQNFAMQNFAMKEKRPPAIATPS